MRKPVKVYREQYSHLPGRFVKKIDQDLKRVLDAELPGLKKVFLFGSCARGEVRSTSDVDLLILTQHRLTERVRASELRWDLGEAVSGVRTDVVYMNMESAEEKSVFHTVLNRDKKLILEVIE